MGNLLASLKKNLLKLPRFIRISRLFPAEEFFCFKCLTVKTVSKIKRNVEKVAHNNNTIEIKSKKSRQCNFAKIVQNFLRLFLRLTFSAFKVRENYL